MDTVELFLSQIKRLSCMAGYTNLSPESITDLAETLQSACHSDDALAQRVISEFTGLPSGTFVPTPGDISARAYQVQHPEMPWVQPREPLCSLCGDSGWVVRETTVEPWPGMKYTVSGAARCKCRGGTVTIAADPQARQGRLTSAAEVAEAKKRKKRRAS